MNHENIWTFFSCFCLFIYLFVWLPLKNNHKQSEGLTKVLRFTEALIENKSLQLYWKRNCHSCFPVNFAKFLITLFIVEDPYWLLLVLFISLKLFIIVDITIDIITHFNLEKGFAFQWVFRHIWWKAKNKNLAER